MFGTLVKKQLLETLSAMFMNKNKSSKKKTGSKIVGFVLLCVFGFLLLSASFFFFSLSICKPLCEAGFAWLYFALFGIVAL